MSTNVSILGRENLINNLSTFSAKVVREFIHATEITQAEVTNFAKQKHPYKDRTGNLTASIQPGSIYITNKTISGVIEARMQYASYVERTHPYLFPAIVASKSKYKKRMVQALKNAGA